MPWLRKGPEKKHVCYPPRPRPDSEWYCPGCMVIWETKFMAVPGWSWVKTDGYMSYD